MTDLTDTEIAELKRLEEVERRRSESAPIPLDPLIDRVVLGGIVDDMAREAHDETRPSEVRLALVTYLARLKALAGLQAPSPAARTATTGAESREEIVAILDAAADAQSHLVRAEALRDAANLVREAAIHGHGMGQEQGFRDGIEAAAKLVAARVARPGLGTMEAIAYRDEIVEAIRALAASSSGDDERPPSSSVGGDSGGTGEYA